MKFHAYKTLTSSRGGAWFYAVCIEEGSAFGTGGRRLQLTAGLAPTQAARLCERINRGESTEYNDKILQALLEWEIAT